MLPIIPFSTRFKRSRISAISRSRADQFIHAFRPFGWAGDGFGAAVDQEATPSEPKIATFKTLVQPCFLSSSHLLQVRTPQKDKIEIPSDAVVSV
jgi:hypothetical protein